MKKGSHHIEESKRKMSESQQGKHHSKKTKAKIRKARIGTHHSKESNQKNREAHIGKHHSKITKRKMSEAKKGENNSFYGKYHTKKTIMKMRESHRRENLSEETIEKMRQVARNRYHSKKTRKRVGIASKKRWQNPEYRERILRAISTGAKDKPTKPERRLRNRLNHLFPSEYKFVGDGTFWIGGKNPDFINVNSQKKVIELFGTYWHSFVKTGRTKKQEENQRIKHFAQYGFKILIVWQNELKNIKRLRTKLIEFHNI